MGRLAYALVAFAAWVGAAVAQVAVPGSPVPDLTVEYLAPDSFAAGSPAAASAVAARKSATSIRFFRGGPGLAVTSDTPSIDFGPGIGVARRTDAIRRAPGDFTWIGKLGDTDDRAMLVVRNGRITGSLVRPTGSSEILALGGDMQALVENDAGRYPPEHPPGPLPRFSARPVIDKAASAVYADGETPVLDVLVVYTTEAKTAYGGDMDGLAQAAVDSTNLAYADSGIAAQMRLAGTWEVNYSGGFNSVLTDMYNGTNGFAELDAKRAEVGADLVDILINDTAYCGLAYINSSAASALSAVYWDCAVGNLSFAHELGHNVGSHHDPYVASGAPFSYGYGYVYLPGRWRTVMAYNNQCSANGFNCTRIGRFSTPLQTYNGVATGTSATNDNARVHNERSATVAAFVTPPDLSLTVDRTGSGLVTSSPAGIDCGATCVGSFPRLSTVTLTATADPGTTFDGWTGACTGTGTCTVSMSAARQVGATFTPNAYTLSLVVAGNQEGSIHAEPSGTDCTDACDLTVEAGTTVDLTATANAGSLFMGWSGACTGKEPTCSLPISGSASVTATFAPASRLTVSKLGGSASALVGSLPTGISCGSACVADFKTGANVLLTAYPGTSSTFLGWSGACTGTSTTCTVAMTTAKLVGARFEAVLRALTVSKAGTGTGTVKSAPSGLTCGATCTKSFPHATSVTLTATAATTSVFAGWSGNCTGTSPTCTLAMTAAKAVTARFDLAQRLLTVTKVGTGSGTVKSTPTGLTCGTVCSKTFAHGTVVTLAATAPSSSVFIGWSGACTGSDPTCTVSMTAARTVSANFKAKPVLSVIKSGSGTGTVRSSPTGIACGTACSAPFLPDASVTLTATAAAGSVFVNWSGACTGASATCTVAMSASKNATAVFGPAP